MNIQSRLRAVVAAILSVVLYGSIGYYLIFWGEQSFLSCVYMTVISITSVGYGEVIPVSGHPGAQIYTMLVITFGLGVITYGISTLTALIVEGEVSGILRKRGMEKKIAKMHGHIIVCGGGQTGRHVVTELVKNREPAVLIEKDQDQIDHILTLVDVPYIQDDATEDENLIKAGIERAAGIVISLPSDKDNLYITMTARMLAPTIRIISRMTNSRLEAKLRKAGANGVVSPNAIGALRMASEMVRPTAVTFLDKMLRSTTQTLRIHEIHISDESPLAGKPLHQSKLRERFGVMVLGLEPKGTEKMVFNPPADFILEPGTILVVMGEMDRIAEARKHS